MGMQETFKALSDPTRREILELLKEKRLTAGEIASHFQMTNATVSHHLAVLRVRQRFLASKHKITPFPRSSFSLLDIRQGNLRNRKNALAQLGLRIPHNRPVSCRICLLYTSRCV